ncbi:MAG: hypothetical protein E5V18_05330 [Mesorhizobium sp.]|nr:MAG: hypothetical protein E5V18_05330 [Mesorhizobium sp.]
MLGQSSRRADCCEQRALDGAAGSEPEVYTLYSYAALQTRAAAANEAKSTACIVIASLTSERGINPRRLNA